MSISKEEFLDWKANPVTERLFEALKADKEQIIEAWVNGAMFGETDTARHSGICSCIDGVLQFNPVEDDE